MPKETSSKRLASISNNCHKSTYASKIDENWSIESNLFFSQGWNVKTTHKSSDHSTCNVVYCHACELCKSFLLLRRTFASYGQLISIFSANDFSISNYDSSNRFSSIFWRIDVFRHVLLTLLLNSTLTFWVLSSSNFQNKSKKPSFTQFQGDKHHLFSLFCLRPSAPKHTYYYYATATSEQRCITFDLCSLKRG